MLIGQEECALAAEFYLDPYAMAAIGKSCVSSWEDKQTRLALHTYITITRKVSS